MTTSLFYAKNIISVVLSAFLFSVSFLAHAAVTFTDTEFVATDWLAAKTADNSPGTNGTFFHQQDAVIGTPAPSLLVSMTWTASGGSSQGMAVARWRPAQVYDPQTQGAVTSIDFSVDARDTVGTFGVVQSGNFFGHNLQFPGTAGTFATKVALGLVPSDFICDAGFPGSSCPATLDFSAGASPMIFGIRIGGTTTGAGVRVRTAWLDNWAVTVHQESLACEIRTDYDPAACSGTFQAGSLADLATYLATDFGRNGGSSYQNLKIVADLTHDVLDIESPCAITLSPAVTLTADFVSLDGRKGVLDDNGYIVNAETACVLSEQDNAGLGAGSIVTADELTVQANKTAKIGLGSSVTVIGSITLMSTGDAASSDAIIKAGSVVSAESISVEASRGAHIGENTNVTATGEIALTSTGDVSASDAGIKSGAQVSAGQLHVSASREAKVGQNSEVTVTGDITVESTGTATGSHAIVKSGAEVDAGGNMDLTSGNKTTIGQNTDVAMTGNLNANAATSTKCVVKSSATIVAGSLSGNCF